MHRAGLLGGLCVQVVGHPGRAETDGVSYRAVGEPGLQDLEGALETHLRPGGLEVLVAIVLDPLRVVLASVHLNIEPPQGLFEFPLEPFPVDLHYLDRLLELVFLSPRHV